MKSIYLGGWAVSSSCPNITMIRCSIDTMAIQPTTDGGTRLLGLLQRATSPMLLLVTPSSSGSKEELTYYPPKIIREPLAKPRETVLRQ